MTRIRAFTAFEIRLLAWMGDALEPGSDYISAFEHLWRLLFCRDTPTAISLLARIISGARQSTFEAAKARYIAKV